MAIQRNLAIQRTPLLSMLNLQISRIHICSPVSKCSAAPLPSLDGEATRGAEWRSLGSIVTITVPFLILARGRDHHKIRVNQEGLLNHIQHLLFRCLHGRNTATRHDTKALQSLAALEYKLRYKGYVHLLIRGKILKYFLFNYFSITCSLKFH
jgi:hypothetical protein